MSEGSNPLEEPFSEAELNQCLFDLVKKGVLELGLQEDGEFVFSIPPEMREAVRRSLEEEDQKQLRLFEEENE